MISDPVEKIMVHAPQDEFATFPINAANKHHNGKTPVSIVSSEKTPVF